MIAALLTLLEVLALGVPACVYARSALHLPVPFTNTGNAAKESVITKDTRTSDAEYARIIEDKDTRIIGRGFGILGVHDVAIDNPNSPPITTSILSLPRGGGDGGSADSSAAIQIITSLAQIEQILQTRHAPLIVLYFTANNCPPCKMIGPIYGDMSELAEFDKVHFCKVNVNDCSDVAERFDVDGWPTFLLFKDGKVVDSIVGGMAAREGLYSLIAKYM